MSDEQDSYVPVRCLTLYTHLNLIIAVLVLYEYVITIRMEMQHVWGKRVSFATWLFYLARYIPIISRIPILLTLNPRWQNSTVGPFFILFVSPFMTPIVQR